MDENTTQPVNPTDDIQVNVPTEGEETEKSEEEKPEVAEESAPEAGSDEAAN